MKNIVILIVLLGLMNSCGVINCIFNDYEPITEIDSVLVEVPIYVPIPSGSDSTSTDSLKMYVQNFSILQGIVDSLKKLKPDNNAVVYIPSKIKDDSVYVETEIAYANAYIKNNKLSIDLNNKKDSLLYYYNYYTFDYLPLLKKYNELAVSYNAIKNKKVTFWDKTKGSLMWMVIGCGIGFFLTHRIVTKQ